MLTPPLKGDDSRASLNVFINILSLDHSHANSSTLGSGETLEALSDTPIDLDLEVTLFHCNLQKKAPAHTQVGRGRLVIPSDYEPKTYWSAHGPG